MEVNIGENILKFYDETKTSVTSKKTSNTFDQGGEY